MAALFLQKGSVVKHLRYLSTFAKLVVLGLLLVPIWGAIWLQSAEHSLGFAKPWVLHSLNPPEAAYAIDFDEVTIDWRDTTKLGLLHITNVTFSDSDGLVFARLPSVNATIDFLGLLPGRNLLHKVILTEPHVSMVRTRDGLVRIGLEGADSSIALNRLWGNEDENPPQKPPRSKRLPFRAFVINHATVKFHDEVTSSDLASNDMSLWLTRRDDKYRGAFLLPFTYGNETAALSGNVVPDAAQNTYRIDATIMNFPSALICTFAPCPEKTTSEGPLNGTARLAVSPTASLVSAAVHLSAQDVTLTAPSWFEKPVSFGKGSELAANYDAATRVAALQQAVLALPDTTITVQGNATQKANGWYVEAQSKTTRLDVTKLPLYWPVFMAPDTRLWVSSKLKSGWAAGTLKLHLKPEDFDRPRLPDEAIDSDIDAHDITVDYLAGFPNMHHVDGQVHFTGTTAKIDGKGGTMLTGTKVSKAHIFCPNLLNPKTPMEVTLVTDMPAADAAAMLALKPFTFDDAWGLDPKQAKGEFTATMQLKFDAFSEHPHGDPDEIHLEAVTYDIKGHLENFSQPHIAQGYDVRNLTGDLDAKVGSTQFSGVLTLGESGTSDIALTDGSGKPTMVTVKSRAEPGKASNDFALGYRSDPAMPRFQITGHRLDASVSYGDHQNSLLRDFPAMALSVTLDELLLASGMPFVNIDGAITCTRLRCESAHFTASSGKSRVKADIVHTNGARQFMLTAGDAGEFLKALDITDRMTGGRLDLHGTYDDAKTPIPFNGQLLIQDFTLKNSQILGRILSIGSLTGLANALTGSGIAFNKMTATLNQRAGVVTISEGRANGAAMGITVSGTIDTNTTKLNLKGVVVPAYMLNSILGNIPIIGALAGGEGEGLIAFNYSVKGTYSTPDVSVNPLSGLTPGFLRGIFGVFDRRPAKPADETPAIPSESREKTGEPTPDPPRRNYP